MEPWNREAKGVVIESTWKVGHAIYNLTLDRKRAKARSNVRQVSYPLGMRHVGRIVAGMEG